MNESGIRKLLEASCSSIDNSFLSASVDGSQINLRNVAINEGIAYQGIDSNEVETSFGHLGYGTSADTLPPTCNPKALVLNAVNPRSYCLSLRRLNLSEDNLEKSLQEASKNCTEFPLKEVPLQAVKAPFLCRRTNEVSPTKIKKSQDMFVLVKNVLKQSVEKNPVLGEKMGVIFEKSNTKMTSSLAKSLVNNIVFSTTSSNVYFQIRNFKTDRSIQAEIHRNPSLITRMRSLLGIEENPTSAMKDDKFVIGTAELDRMKTMMAEEGLSLEEQQKIKVAFAEGYLAGHGSKNPSKTVKWLKVLQHVLTIILFFGIFVSLMASASGSVFRIQLGNQSEVDPEEINVTFNDVKGVDEAKQELKDVVEFLKNPEKFSSLGGKLPKGVLLVGPPGTGKTLLARAVAGEAGVPFFHAAGPEFDEILVGQGARRVRDLFKAAKERAPCVIFIDEIDSVGAKRTNAVLHPYANQTINQLLSEMDGFHQNEGVIVLGATNRREDLDKALLRPGRFDVEVNVPAPDYSGRKEILTMYLSRIRSKNIDVDILARGTTGFTGADLENMINQAALRAAIEGADFVTMKYLEVARDKVIMGPERKSRIMDDETNEITAYHEGGHAVVAYYTKDSHPLHKVTIIPRGPSLGHTAYIPEKERYHVTKSQLLAMMDTMMGGRAAEELIFGPDKITSGASSDLKQATAIATHMVKDWGMSEKAGLRTHDTDKQGLIQISDLSPTTSAVLDNEIQRILQESYERAKAILKNHQKEHKMLAEALLKYETLDADDIKAIMSGKKEPEKDLASRKEPQKTDLIITSS